MASSSRQSLRQSQGWRLRHPPSLDPTRFFFLVIIRGATPNVSPRSSSRSGSIGLTSSPADRLSNPSPRFVVAADVDNFRARARGSTSALRWVWNIHLNSGGSSGRFPKFVDGDNHRRSTRRRRYGQRDSPARTSLLEQFYLNRNLFRFRRLRVGCSSRITWLALSHSAAKAQPLGENSSPKPDS